MAVGAEHLEGLGVSPDSGHVFAAADSDASGVLAPTSTVDVVDLKYPSVTFTAPRTGPAKKVDDLVATHLPDARVTYGVLQRNGHGGI